MSDERYLIVNADDFGLSPGVNRGTIEAHERGIVTSASLMVRGLGAAEAAGYARLHPRLSVGLHLDLGEWAYRARRWEPVYEVVPLDDAVAVGDEVARQLDVFRSLVGIDPTHLDSHQHVHRRETVIGIVGEIAADLRVPLRHEAAGIHYCGDFYGQTAKGAPAPGQVTVDALVGILEKLSPGVTELATHPGIREELDSVYCTERVAELEVLCDARVRAKLVAEAVQLCSFHDVGGYRVEPESATDDDG